MAVEKPWVKSPKVMRLREFQCPLDGQRMNKVASTYPMRKCTSCGVTVAESILRMMNE